MIKFENPQLPAYANEINGWLYNNMQLSNSYDREFWVNLRRFGQNQRLINSVVREISLSQTVLQLGATFGSQLQQTAARVGVYSRYDVCDINLLQLQRCISKFGNRNRSLHFIQKDVRQPFDGDFKYDVVICYMLLHEVPPMSKAQIINNALNQVREGGKVIFVDYHNPISWHPFRYFLRMFNRLYQPFVEKLWERDISTYADMKLRGEFAWSKSLFFGGVFQKTLAVKKIPIKH